MQFTAGFVSGVFIGFVVTAAVISKSICLFGHCTGPLF